MDNRDVKEAASNIVNTPGAGLRGEIGGVLYTIGTPSFVELHTGHRLLDKETADDVDSNCSLVLLANPSSVLCAFVLSDELRPDARSLVQSLQQQGITASLYSGDRSIVTSHIAETIGIANAIGDLSPEDKLRLVRGLQAEGEIVAMVGDGINDTPVLAAANVSIAMGDGTQAARASADMILLGGNLANLSDGVAIARKTLSIIHQNLLWAVAYNLLAIPAAATGWIAPWMAAI